MTTSKKTETKETSNKSTTNAMQDGQDASTATTKIDSNAVKSNVNVATSTKNTDTDFKSTVQVPKGNKDPGIIGNVKATEEDLKHTGQSSIISILRDNKTITLNIPNNEADKLIEKHKSTLKIEDVDGSNLKAGQVNKSAPFAFGATHGYTAKQLKKLKHEGAYQEGEVNPSAPPAL